MHVEPRDLAIYCGLATLAFTGWNLYFHAKISSLTALWRWKDQFLKEYQADKLRTVEKFATKDEVARALEKIDLHFLELRRSIDRLRENLEECD